MLVKIQRNFVQFQKRGRSLEGDIKMSATFLRVLQNSMDFEKSDVGTSKITIFKIIMRTVMKI